MLDVCLLGTGGMTPLPYRWLTALLTRYNGSSLLIEKMAQRGITRIVLEVRVSNDPAIRLYERHGFLVVGTRKNFYEKPVEDAYVMVREPVVSTSDVE